MAEGMRVESKPWGVDIVFDGMSRLERGHQTDVKLRRDSDAGALLGVHDVDEGMMYMARLSPIRAAQLAGALLEYAEREVERPILELVEGYSGDTPGERLQRFKALTE